MSPVLVAFHHGIEVLEFVALAWKELENVFTFEEKLQNVFTKIIICTSGLEILKNFLQNPDSSFPGDSAKRKFLIWRF